MPEKEKEIDEFENGVGIDTPDDATIPDAPADVPEVTEVADHE